MILLRSVLIFSAFLGLSAAFSDFPVIQNIFNFFTSNGASDNHNATRYKDYLNMPPEELGISRGQCTLNFLDYVSHKDQQMCAIDDQYILHLLPPLGYFEQARKPPIMVKCLQRELPQNTTRNDISLLIVSSVKEIVTLLKPIGNATKRHEPGSCVLVFFYTESSLGCAHMAPYTNVLPLLFPTLRVAAIDAFKFPSFNTEFGIVGLPTLLLFHQGRPVVKFYSDVGTFSTFVTRHTGIKPVGPVPTAAEIKGPLPLKPIQKPDYILVLAWGFILLCLGNYFAKSQLCKQIVEMVKRNWRESEAQLEHN